jgi:hypothetical protein
MVLMDCSHHIRKYLARWPLLACWMNINIHNQFTGIKFRLLVISLFQWLEKRATWAIAVGNNYLISLIKYTEN